MKDQISIERLEQLHPKVKDTFKSFIEDIEKEFNTTFRIVQGLRTIQEQNDLYAQGRTKKGKIVTNAKGGSSFHNYGLGIDIAELKNGNINWSFDYSKLKPIAKKYNIEWGGDWKTIIDKPHYQVSFGYTWQQLFDKYNHKDFISGTNYVKI